MQSRRQELDSNRDWSGLSRQNKSENTEEPGSLQQLSRQTGDLFRQGHLAEAMDACGQPFYASCHDASCIDALCPLCEYGPPVGAPSPPMGVCNTPLPAAGEGEGR